MHVLMHYFLHKTVLLTLYCTLNHRHRHTYAQIYTHHHHMYTHIYICTYSHTSEYPPPPHTLNTQHNITQTQAEKQMDLMKDLIHGGRSLRSDYKLANHIKADFYFTCSSPDMRAIINNWGQDFCTLARANQLVELDPSTGVKKGFCVKVISDQTSLFIDLTEIIDVSSEIVRLNKERERLELSIDTYVKKINVTNYESKVPESIRIVNSEKISSFELELEATIKAISSFELMKA